MGGNFGGFKVLGGTEMEFFWSSYFCVDLFASERPINNRQRIVFLT